MMLAFDRTAARAAWTVFLMALLIATAYAIRETLVVFAAALFFAYMLMPIVSFVERHTPKAIGSTIALSVVYLAFLGLVIALLMTIGARIADEASSLAQRLPDLIQNRQWVQQIPLPSWLEPVRDRIVAWIQNQFSTGGKDLIPALKNIGGQLVYGMRYALYAVLIPILAFFFLKDGHELRERLVHSVVPDKQLKVVEEILSDLNILLGQYIRALVLLSVSTFVCYSVFLEATGAPYAVLLAGCAALFDFIPVVGPLAAGVLVITVTGVTGYTHLLWYIIFWIVFRMFQDYVLGPYLMGSGTELNPMLVLFGVMAGEQVAGVAGMFFSVPVIAALRVIFVRLQRSRQKRMLSTVEMQR
jgi:predicted PurR-regulated permease PerM